MPVWERENGIFRRSDKELCVLRESDIMGRERVSVLRA